MDKGTHVRATRDIASQQRQVIPSGSLGIVVAATGIFGGGPDEVVFLVHDNTLVLTDAKYDEIERA